MSEKAVADFESILTMSGVWSRQIVLRLYRQLLREAETLKYTDQNFFRRRIQQEFRKNIAETDEGKKVKHVQRGNHMLQTKLGGLV
ncbi:mitochondrial ribosome and complex I assembly factor AltMIEF1-like [Asterias amurensis]|uniref:mitochondrial ribosome and complex I assembly factor AltMIEF1-like n=1 Tax=Asterias amurensis TaxID=7602 RepID=UPI003AB6E173